MPRFIVSACLAGLMCRYDGSSNPHPEVMRLVATRQAIPVCPEALAGLSIPRLPCEMRGKGIFNKDGANMTEAFILGAQKALRIAKQHGCREAILKNRSPSCGVDHIYDGTFSGTLIPGMGLLAQLLRQQGFKLYTEEHMPEV